MGINWLPSWWQLIPVRRRRRRRRGPSAAQRRRMAVAAAVAQREKAATNRRKAAERGISVFELQLRRCAIAFVATFAVGVIAGIAALIPN